MNVTKCVKLGLNRRTGRMRMTDSDWNKALTGAGDREVIVNGDHTRVRYLVSDAIRLQATASSVLSR